MKILVVADIHANYRALKATLDAFDNVDEVWCLGDIVEYGPMPSACIDLVRQHCNQVVAGNHDLSFANCQQQGANGDQGGRDFHAHTLRERDQTSLIRRNPALFDCRHDNRYVFMRRNRDFVYAPLGNPGHFVQ